MKKTVTGMLLALAVRLANAEASLTATGTPSSSAAIAGADSGSAKTLNEGVNTLTITVTAQDGVTKKNYAITAVRFGAKYTSATIGDLLYVPAGTFQRTATAGDTSSVSAFRMSRTEITRDAFKKIMGSLSIGRGCRFSGTGYERGSLLSRRERQA